MLRVIEVIRELRALREALAGPMGQDHRDRVELLEEISAVEWELSALQAGQLVQPRQLELTDGRMR